MRNLPYVRVTFELNILEIRGPLWLFSMLLCTYLKSSFSPPPQVEKFSRDIDISMVYMCNILKLAEVLNSRNTFSFSKLPEEVLSKTSLPLSILNSRFVQILQRWEIFFRKLYFNSREKERETERQRQRQRNRETIRIGNSIFSFLMLFNKAICIRHTHHTELNMHALFTAKYRFNRETLS